METKRHFEVSVTRWCGEFVVGRVSRAFHDYWSERDESGLASHLLGLDDPDARDAGSPPMLVTGEDPSGWYEVDDVVHVNGAVAMPENLISIREVEPDDDSYTGFRPLDGGYEADYSIGDLPDVMEPRQLEAMIRCVKSVEAERGVEAPEDPVVVCKSIEKGLQTLVVVETTGGFLLEKLAFDIVHVDGDDVIQAVSYDGVEYESMPDSSTGKSFLAWVGDLYLGGVDLGPGNFPVRHAAGRTQISPPVKAPDPAPLVAQASAMQVAAPEPPGVAAICSAAERMGSRRYFRVSVTHYCGEYVASRVSRAFHDYWQAQPPDRFLQHLVNLDDPDEPEGRDPNSPPMLRDGTDPHSWDSADEVLHVTGASFMEGNFINVDEVVPNQDEELAWTPFVPLEGGFSAQYAIGELEEHLTAEQLDRMCETVMSVEIEQDVDAPVDPGFVMTSVDKGMQTLVYLETDGDFDLSKVTFNIIDVDGNMVIQTVFYDGQPLELEADSWVGKGYLAWVGDLHVTGEDVRPEPVPLSLYSDDAASEAVQVQPVSRASRRGGKAGAWARAVQVFTTLLILGLMTVVVVASFLYSTS